MDKKSSKISMLYICTYTYSNQHALVVHTFSCAGYTATPTIIECINQ